MLLALPLGIYILFEHDMQENERMEQKTKIVLSQLIMFMYEWSAIEAGAIKNLKFYRNKQLNGD